MLLSRTLRFGRLWFMGTLLCLWACTGAVHRHAAAADPTNSQTIYVVHNDWHAAIVLEKAEVPVTLVPETADFPTARYLEFSWGDKDYFPDPQASLFTAVKAAFWSRGSVMHLVGLDRGPVESYQGAKIIGLRRSQVDLARLVAYLGATFARPEAGKAAPSRPGLFHNSRFYNATGNFSLLHTCNTWVAEALAAANLPIEPSGVITAGDLEDTLHAILPPSQ